MSLTYFRRLRMELPLSGLRLEPQPLLEGFVLLPWDAGLLEAHATAKYRSFRHELDANVFSNLASRRGCRRIMQDICRKPGFLPEATWLLAARGMAATGRNRGEFCGTIQGVRDEEDRGWIQNFGIVPELRGQGLGKALMFRALAGFRQAGIKRAMLEVTAENDAAIRLYRRLGFAVVKTLYKAIELNVPELAWA